MLSLLESEQASPGAQPWVLSLPPWAEPLAGQSTGLSLQAHAVLSSWWTESQLSLCGPRPPRAGPPGQDKHPGPDGTATSSSLQGVT